MLRDDVQELWDAHTKMQQTVARLSDNAEALATAQAANARYKKHITEQDARALRIEDQHKQYVEGVGKSFVCMQNDMQAFVVQMTDNVNEQILHAKEDIDSNKKFLAERDAGHKDYVRELTESFEARLAEQTKASELAEVHTRTQLTESFEARLAEQTKTSQLAEVHTRTQLTESFEARLAEQTKASQLAEMHTRSQLDLVSQELLGFKQGMCLPLAVSESIDSESLNIFDESDERAETIESINAFLEPFQDSLDDEIGQVLAAAACGQKRSVDNGAAAGLCAFELQAIVYPQAGDVLFTSKAGKSLAGQQAGAQARERTAAWSPPPRECALCFVLCALCFVLCALLSDLTRALSTYRALQVQGRRQRFLQVQEQLLQVAGGNLRDLHG
jgi:hypothetical protein